MMTPKERVAVQQALEALEYDTTPDAEYGINAAITALREALAEQAEQEPVAWYSVKGGFNNCGEGKPLYAAPVRTKDLTDDEIWKVIDTINHSAHIEDLNPFLLCRAVIAKFKEKNK